MCLFLVTVHATPWILSTAKRLAVGAVDGRVAADDGERQLGLEHTVVAIRLDVVVVQIGKLVDLQLVLVDHAQHVRLELLDLVGRHRVRFGYDRNQVDAIVQFFHHLDVELLQS